MGTTDSWRNIVFRATLATVMASILCGGLACGHNGMSVGLIPPGPGAEDVRLTRTRTAAQYFGILWDPYSEDYDAVNQAIESISDVPGSESWLIVLLLGVRYFDQEHALKDLQNPGEPKARMILPRGFLAHLLGKVPETASPALLWAVTCHLEDERRGRRSWVETSPSGKKIAVDGVTRPIRDIAREALKRTLHVDYEYDTYQWCKEILRRTDYRPHDDKQGCTGPGELGSPSVRVDE